MSRGTLATISRSALRHNFQQIKNLAPNSKVWSVVKANAYGHGAIGVATVLAESDGFAVSTLDEGIALREAGIENPILLLEGVTQPSHLNLVVQHNLQCVFHCQSQVDHLLNVRLSKPILGWIKIDTGMHRLGFTVSECQSLWGQLAQLSQLTINGVMTHFASADDEAQDSATQSQYETFQAVAPAHLPHSLANSAAILRHPETHADWVRPGITLYGASPIQGERAESFNLNPVMTFTTPVIAVRTIQAGDRVGYGQRWQASRESRIATLAVGYGDGYPRHAPDGTPVWLNGQRVPLVGRVSMDMLTVDVTDLHSVKVGDIAELWGQSLSVDDVAEFIGTIGYELLTRLSPRVDYKIVD